MLGEHSRWLALCESDSFWSSWPFPQGNEKEQSSKDKNKETLHISNTIKVHSFGIQYFSKSDFMAPLRNSSVLRIFWPFVTVSKRKWHTAALERVPQLSAIFSDLTDYSSHKSLGWEWVPRLSWPDTWWLAWNLLPAPILQTYSSRLDLFAIVLYWTSYSWALWSAEFYIYFIVLNLNIIPKYYLIILHQWYITLTK